MFRIIKKAKCSHCFNMNKTEIILFPFFFLFFFFLNDSFVGSQCTNCCSITRGEELSQPLEFSLEKKLELMVSPINISCISVERRLFNGNLTGPTWRFAFSGLGYELSVENFLHTNGEELDSLLLYYGSAPFYFSSESIPTCKNVGPESQCSSIFNVRTGSGDLIGGTYMYRSLAPGFAQFQAESGLSGMIIIEDDLEKLPSPLNETSTDVVLLFQDLKYSLNSTSSFSQLQIQVNDSLRLSNSHEIEWLENPENGIDFITVNGLVEPVLYLNVGECKRFRLGNAASIEALVLQVVSTACQATQIAQDGFYLGEKRNVSSNGMVLLPGSTADWLFSCQNEGIFQIRSNSHSINLWNYPIYNGLLFTVNVTNNPNVSPLGCPDNLPLQSNPATDEPEFPHFNVEMGGPPNITQSTCQNQSGNDLSAIQIYNIINRDQINAVPFTIQRSELRVLSYNNFSGPCFVCNNGMWSLFANNCNQCENEYQQTCDSSQSTCILACDENYNHVSESGSSLGYATVQERRSVILVPPASNLTVYVNFIDVVYFSTTDETQLQSTNLPYTDQGALLVIDVTERFASNTSCDRECFVSTTTTTATTATKPITSVLPPPPPTCTTLCIALSTTAAFIAMIVLPVLVWCYYRVQHCQITNTNSAYEVP